MLDIMIMRNLRISIILQFFFLVYLTVIVSIFYTQLKKEEKDISNSDIDGTGITAFVILAIGLLLVLYQIYHIYYSIPYSA